MTLQTMNIDLASSGKFQKTLEWFILITLPLYFVLDASNHFWGWVPIESGIAVFFTASLALLALYLVLKIFMLAHKATIFLVWVATNYLFFKVIKDWLVANGATLFTSYSFFIPFLGLLSLFILFLIHRLSSASAQRIVFYLSSVFLVLAIVEVGKSVHNYLNVPVKPFSTAKVEFVKLTEKKHPDIFILQLDEYAGLNTLSKEYNINNGAFVDALKKRSFHVSEKPNSNYNGTSFSVLSFMNMNYIDSLDRREVSSAIAYSKSVDAIKQNYLMLFFKRNGYTIHNHSFFEVMGTKSLNYLFLPVKKRLMLDKTFGQVLLNDLFCSINSNSFHYFVNDYSAQIDNYNQSVIERSLATIDTGTSPMFMYAHFMMPHSPFLRDSSGRLRNMGKAYRESNKRRDMESYRQYLIYCNSVALKIIDSLQKKKPQSIVVLMSDHGLRNSGIRNKRYSEFNNFVAIYSPENKISELPDSLPTVNIFRMVMNKHFGQNLPMLENKMINVNMGLNE